MVLKRVAFAAGALLVSVLLSLPMARGQPFRFDAAPLQPAPSEAAQRVANDYQGFTFDFSTATASGCGRGLGGREGCMRPPGDSVARLA